MFAANTWKNQPLAVRQRSLALTLLSGGKHIPALRAAHLCESHPLGLVRGNAVPTFRTGRRQRCHDLGPVNLASHLFLRRSDLRPPRALGGCYPFAGEAL